MIPFYPRFVVCIPWSEEHSQHLGNIFGTTYGKRLRKTCFVLCGKENLQPGRFVLDQDDKIVQYLAEDRTKTPCYTFKYNKVENLFWSEELYCVEGMCDTVLRVLYLYGLPQDTPSQKIPKVYGLQHIMPTNPILCYLQSACKTREESQVMEDNLLRKLKYIVEKSQRKPISTIKQLKHQCYNMNGIFSIDVVLTREKQPRKETLKQTLGSFFGSFHAGLNIDMTYLHINAAGEYLLEDLWMIPHEEVDRNKVLIQIPVLIYEPDDTWYADLLGHIQQMDGHKTLFQIVQRLMYDFAGYLPSLSSLARRLTTAWSYSIYDHCQDFVQAALDDLGLANCNLLKLHGFPGELAWLINQIREDSTEVESLLEREVSDISLNTIAFKVIQTRFRIFRAMKNTDWEILESLKEQHADLLSELIKLHSQQFLDNYSLHRDIYRYRASTVVPTYYPVFVPIKKEENRRCLIS